MSFLDSRTRAAREGIGKPVMLSVKLQPLEAAFRGVTREKVGALWFSVRGSSSNTDSASWILRPRIGRRRSTDSRPSSISAA